MPRLLTTAAIRDPKPARPPRRGESAIHTHPQTATSTGTAQVSSLHGALFAAWQEERWAEIAAVARRHLEGAGAGSRLHPTTTAAIAFFAPGASALTGADVAGFIASFEPAALDEYLKGPHAHDRAALADEALALHVLGALGQARSDPVASLRAATAFASVARLGDRAQHLNMGAIRRALEADVYLPAWSFDLDPCGRRAKRLPPGRTPLEGKLAALAAHEHRPDCDCDCEGSRPCAPQDPCCAELRYYVADLLELRDWTHCYKAGDLAYIEVVAAGELRSREHEMRRTRELFMEQETSGRWSEKRDHQVTEKASLQREIERQAEASLSLEAGVGGKYDSGTYSAEFSASGAFKKSSAEAIRETQERARELVASAVTEIEKQTRTLRSEKVTTDEVEKNVHSFDNAGGTTPKVTKYFWVTQVRRAQLFSYDQHLICELLVPSPARLFERLVEVRREAEVAKLPKPAIVAPKQPAAPTFGAGAINADNYQQLCAQFGVANAPPPPALTKQITGTKDHSGSTIAHNTLSPGIQFNIPQDHQALAMHLWGAVEYRPSNWLQNPQPKKVEFSLGGYFVWFLDGGDKLDVNLQPPVTGTVFVNVEAWNIKSMSATVALDLALTPAALAAWQQSVFALIEEAHAAAMAAYEEALAEYDKVLAEFKAAQDKLREELKAKERSRHPLYNRELERTELKRAAIYLMCQNYSNQGAVIPKAEPCGFTEIHRGRAAEMGDEWYFWDRLFDWKRMAYAFFDYFWNPICSWPDRFDPDEPDALFRAFLRAGYARVLVPVNPDMQADFLWYASTRGKWGQTGKPPLNPNDPRWRNVVYELQHANECAMTPREGFVDNPAPGDLTLLVKGSDRYWDAQASAVDPVAVAEDLDRELIVDGATYLVADIQLDPGSPAYNPGNPDTMWWRLTLDRPYEGAASPRRLYAMGAQAVAPVFSFDMPTELIWASAHDDCLPCYPLPPCAP